MSLKHRVFPVGPPNVVSYATGIAVQVTDEMGLSNDPAHFANPKCKTCWGRGVVRTNNIPTACGCVAPRRAKTRHELVQIMQAVARQQEAERIKQEAEKSAEPPSDPTP